MGQDERSIVCVDDRCHDVTTLQMEDNANGSLKIGRLKSSSNLNHNPGDSKLSNAEERPICRICHCSNEDVEMVGSPNDTTAAAIIKKKLSPKLLENNKFINLNDPFFLITPCYCTGTLQYVHHKCLQQWIRSSNHKYCELCKYSFNLKTRNKPLYQWECLNMSRGERRKLLFHISFNLISMICVFWSIYVIAERASLELSGRLGWRFWIKMLVVTIGFICGIMFIFFQLKLYLSIFTRWKQYNQIIIIENVYKNEILSPINDTKDCGSVQNK